MDWNCSSQAGNVQNLLKPDSWCANDFEKHVKRGQTDSYKIDSMKKRHFCEVEFSTAKKIAYPNDNLEKSDQRIVLFPFFIYRLL